MRHFSDCLCNVCIESLQDKLECAKEAVRKQAEENRLREERKAIMQILGIPLDTEYSVKTKDLCDIFLDDEKCEVLISKLKNKAFW